MNKSFTRASDSIAWRSCGACFKRVFQFDIERGGNHFREAIDFAIGHVHGAADVFHCGFGGHRSECNNLRDIFAAVFSRHIFNHFASAAHAEVDINIGQRDAFWIQEALEEQIILHGIDVGDLQRIADETARGGTAAGANGNSLRAGVANKIPDDQKISGKLHALNHANFVGEARFVIGERATETSGSGKRFQMLHAIGEALANNFFKMRVGSVAFGNLEIRETDSALVRFSHCNARRLSTVRSRASGISAKILCHFFGGLEIKLVGGKFHAVRVAHRFAGLDAEQDFLSACVGLRQIVAIVCGDQRNAGFFGEPDDILINFLFEFEALILNFQEEIIFAENILQAIRGGARFFVARMRAAIRLLRR